MRAYRAVITAAVLAGFCITVSAEDSIVGKYSGSFQNDIGKTTGVALVIDSVQDGRIKGTLTRYRSGKNNSCQGDYPMEGRLEGNVLTMKSTERQGLGEGRGFSLKVTANGNKLTGTAKKDNPIELSK